MSPSVEAMVIGVGRGMTQTILTTENTENAEVTQR